MYGFPLEILLAFTTKNPIVFLHSLFCINVNSRYHHQTVFFISPTGLSFFLQSYDVQLYWATTYTKVALLVIVMLLPLLLLFLLPIIRIIYTSHKHSNLPFKSINKWSFPITMYLCFLVNHVEAFNSMNINLLLLVTINAFNILFDLDGYFVIYFYVKQFIF